MKKFRQELYLTRLSTDPIESDAGDCQVEISERNGRKWNSICATFSRRATEELLATCGWEPNGEVFGFGERVHMQWIREIEVESYPGEMEETDG